MTTFAEGQTVRIIRAPRDAPDILGCGAMVSEDGGSYVYVQVFNVVGEVKCCGSIPKDCVVIENSPILLSFKRLHDENAARYRDGLRIYAEKASAAIDETARQCGITPDKVREVLLVWSGENPRSQ